MSRKYTEAQLESIKHAWEVERLSAHEIAADFPELKLTRNAVLGLVDRNGFKKPRSPAKRRSITPSPAPHRRPAVPSKSEDLPDLPKALLKPREIAMSAKPKPLPTSVCMPIECVPIHELERGQCKWPVTTDAEGRHLFCGKGVQAGKTDGVHQPYCSEHAARSRAGYKAEADEA